MTIQSLAKKTIPLCFFPNGNMVCYHLGDFVIYEDNHELKRFHLSTSIKERIIGRIKIISRMLRLGVRVSEAIDDNSFVFSISNMLYEFNVSSGELSNGYSCGHGIRPLAFTTINGIDGFDRGIYFGGYLGNDNKEPVSIYHRIGVDNWKIVYTFPQGKINHIHKIVPDPYRGCVWIFTGDFGEASAIWKATENFKQVKLVAGNNQKYRGCVAYALQEGLLYATDTPFTDNFIYLFDTESLNSKTLFPIEGSCIYGCRWKNYYIFSSTVEGCFEPSWSRLRWMTTRKRGEGIKDNYAHLYMGNLKEGFKEIYKEKKDCMPFYTFQFGVFKFPAGMNNTETLYFQPVATKKNDLCLMSYSE